jgi:hypothetical protein
MTTRDNENAPAEGPDPSTRAHKQAGDLVRSVTDRRAGERSRRSRRWARRELDAVLGVPESAITTVDYDAMGFTLGVPERRAAGLALLEAGRGRAA